MKNRAIDYYSILQISRDAEPIVIEAAYRRLARKYHPDVDKSPNATKHMKDINEAYRILSSPSLRAQYDASFSYSEPIIQSYPRATEHTDAGVKEQRKSGPWWKWFLVIPAWPFGFLVPGGLLKIVGGLWVSDDSLESLWLELVVSGIGGYCAVYFPSRLAPTLKFGISIAAGLLVAVVAGVGMFATLLVWEGWSLRSVVVVLSLVVTVAGAGGAIYGVRNDNS